MQVLKDLKRFFHGCYRGGNPFACACGNLRGPPRSGLQGRRPFTVGRGPVPRHAIGTGNGVGWRAFFAQVECSRGTGPRATGSEGVLLAMHRSGSGEPELRSPASNLANRDNRAHLLLILLILKILLLSGPRLWGTRANAGACLSRRGVLCDKKILLEKKKAM